VFFPKKPNTENEMRLHVAGSVELSFGKIAIQSLQAQLPLVGRGSLIFSEGIYC
jgi:hypothetical protein